MLTPLLLLSLLACPAASDRTELCAPWSTWAPPVQGASVDMCSETALVLTYRERRPQEAERAWSAWADAGWEPVVAADQTWLGEGHSLTLFVDREGEETVVSLALSPTQ